MRVGLVGNGGREHAIAEALTRRSSTSALYAYMQRPNPGIVACAQVSEIGSLTDTEHMARFFRRAMCDLIFIGPESPLVAGAVDALSSNGLKAIGPTAAQAKLESDKGYMRHLLQTKIGRGCPDFLETADLSAVKAFLSDHHNQAVVKPLGLTGGKGVKVLGTQLSSAEEALEYAAELINQDGKVLIEEKLVGEEFSLMVFSDGEHIVPMPLAQDFKYVYDGDRGGMTGGMGAYTCRNGLLPFISESEYQAALELVQELVSAVEEDSQQPYRGILYGQFMLTARGPMVVECNVRLGDPEAINVLAVLNDDLGSVLNCIGDGVLSKVAFDSQATVSKYFVPPGYPDAPRSGVFFRLDVDKLLEQGIAVRFASLQTADSGYRTATSRTFALLATADSPEEASDRIEKVVATLDLDGLHHRRDVGDREVLAAKVQHMEQIRGPKTKTLT